MAQVTTLRATGVPGVLQSFVAKSPSTGTSRTIATGAIFEFATAEGLSKTVGLGADTITAFEFDVISPGTTSTVPSGGTGGVPEGAMLSYVDAGPREHLGPGAHRLRPNPEAMKPHDPESEG